MAAPSVHAIFAQFVASTPSAVAVSDGNGETITYSQLSASARSLGAKLQSLGIGPEKAVAVVVERSFHMFTGMLGALFAGGAYVAIDHTYPVARIEFILNDTEASVLLTTSDLKSFVPPSFTGTVVVLDEEKDLPPPEALNIVSELKPENLFAMFYTSGTTGWPKVGGTVL